MRRPVSIFFGQERGMAFFVAFLALVVVLVPMITLSQPWRIALSLTFCLTLAFGAVAIIQHRVLMYLTIFISIANTGVDLVAEFDPSQSFFILETMLRLITLSILVFMTVKKTLNPGRITVYRVLGGIAGYLLIGLVWAFAYQLVAQQDPNAIHFSTRAANIPSGLPTQMFYFSFTTLTTVGYGDAYPALPAARSLAVAEALVGQLYIAILIASLVGMALEARSRTDRKDGAVF
jgi:hypothetical protein